MVTDISEKFLFFFWEQNLLKTDNAEETALSAGNSIAIHAYFKRSNQQ